MDFDSDSPFLIYLLHATPRFREANDADGATIYLRPTYLHQNHSNTSCAFVSTSSFRLHHFELSGSDLVRPTAILDPCVTSGMLVPRGWCPCIDRDP